MRLLYVLLHSRMFLTNGNSEAVYHFSWRLWELDLLQNNTMLPALVNWRRTNCFYPFAIIPNVCGMIISEWVHRKRIRNRIKLWNWGGQTKELEVHPGLNKNRKEVTQTNREHQFLTATWVSIIHPVAAVISSPLLTSLIAWKCSFDWLFSIGKCRSASNKGFNLGK